MLGYDIILKTTERISSICCNMVSSGIYIVYFISPKRQLGQHFETDHERLLPSLSSPKCIKPHSISSAADTA
jgi:hypothetical protein